MNVRAVLIALLLAALVPPMPADASHAPPPAPCHPRGCQEALTLAGPQTGGPARVDATGARAYVGGTRTVNGTTIFASSAFDVATDSVAWARTISVGSMSTVQDVAVSPGGSRLVMVGQASSGSSLDYVVLVQDAATGDVVHAGASDGGYEARYNDGAEAVEADDERAYVGGYFTRPAPQCNGMPGAAARFSVSAIDLGTGTSLWAAEVSDRVFAHDLVMHLAGGRVFYTAAFQDCTTAFRPIAALDAATGTPLWNRSIEQELSHRYSFDDMASSPDGSILYLAGHDYETGSHRALLWALDAATGATLWNATFLGPQGSSMGLAVAVSPDGGSVAYAVRDKVSFSGFRTMVMAYAPATGALLWETETAVSFVRSLAYSPDGTHVLVSGEDSGGARTVVLRSDAGAFVFQSFLGGGAGVTTGWMTADGEHVLTAGNIVQSNVVHVYLRRAAAVAPPEAPTVSTAPMANGSIEVTWTPPEDDGGRPITAYVVSRAVSFIDRPFTPVASVAPGEAYVDTDTTRGTRYWYRVQAANDVSLGVADHEDEVSVSVPSPPQNVLAAAGSQPGQVRVQWDPPASDGGLPLTGYRLRVFDAGDGALVHDVTLVPLASAYVYDGRALGGYVFEVSASNALGEGPSASSGCTRGMPFSAVELLGLENCVLVEELAPIEDASPV